MNAIVAKSDYDAIKKALKLNRF